MRRWLAIVTVFTLAACGSGSPSAQSAKTASPTATPTAKSSVTPAAPNRAVDSYPSAPLVSSSASGFLGNGVYGNALLLSGPDTWYWDGVAWHHANARISDWPRTPSVYDPALKKSVVLTNGETGAPVGTWAWSGTGWSNLQASPPGETGPSLLGYHAGAQQLVAVVNATWLFDGTNWVSAGGLDSPQIRRGTVLVYDPLTRQLILFGGMAYEGSKGIGDTWTWDGKAWTLHHPKGNPPAGWASIAYDPDSRQLLLVVQEMADYTTAPASLSMWSWDGADWHQLHPTALPPFGLFPSMTYDLANHQLIYFLGVYQSAPNGPGGTQTWVYTKGTWVRAG